MSITVSEKESLQKMMAISKSIVNSFYNVHFDYPVSIAKGPIQVMMLGLLPWAKSGIRKKIILRVPGITQDQITHEMSHLALKKITGYKEIPLWFDEGLACYISKMNFIGSAQNLKIALAAKKGPDILSWASLTGKLKWLYQMYILKNTNLIYGQGYYMIDYLLKKYTQALVIHFITQLGQALFPDAFEKTFGLSMEIFYTDFLRAIDDI